MSILEICLKLLQKERRGKRRKQLLNDVMEKTGHWKSKDEAPDRTLWRTSFGGLALEEAMGLS
jgi:hypothetical protein